ncbi:unnamed protein product [Schistosoma turkestanicum]|nr:unnamed protein product [Schistosoma turkestanicum]
MILNDCGNKIIESDSSVLEPQSTTGWSEDDFDKETLSQEEASGEVRSPCDFDYRSPSQAVTPSNNNETELVLDHFSKEELITMVKDLSEQLFETKGQLVEQEARLRAEMCDNMNQQIIDFENKFEALLKTRENYLYEQSNVRMQNIIESVNQRQTRLKQNSKRLCPDDSEASNISSSSNDSSDSSSSSDEEEISKVNNNSLQENIKRKQSLGICNNCLAQTTKITQLLQTIKQLENQIAELQGDLADQKDIIENLMHELDRIRVENRRLDFTIAQQQQQQQSIKLTADVEIQKELNDEHVASSNDSSNSTELDDSCIIINMPKKITTTCEDYDTNKLVNSSLSCCCYKSPASNVTAQESTGCTSGNTPSTLIKESNKLLLPEHQQNSIVSVNKNQISNNEIKSIHVKNNKYAVNNDVVRESRISEGLLSFLEHETSIQHQELIDQLRRQIYDIEKKFTMKHDALVKSETDLQELKLKYDEISQRLISQTNELHQCNLNITKLKQAHHDELLACHNDAQKRIDQLQTEYNIVLEQNNALIARVPNHDMQIQTSMLVESTNLPTTESISMQTLLCQMNEMSIQVNPMSFGVSIGIQTEKPNEIDTSESSMNNNATTTVATIIQHQGGKSIETNTHTSSENLTNNHSIKRNLRNASRLRLKQTGGRLTQRFGPPPKIPQLPSPLPTSSVCLSDSELELSAVTLHDVEEEEDEAAKENINHTTGDDETSGESDSDEDNDDEDDDDDDVRSCRSEPQTTTKNRQAVRRKKATNTREKTSTTTRRTRQTRSTTTTTTVTGPPPPQHRRLPPLTESTQLLLPDSFFQDQLDEALESVEIELRKTEQRNLRQLNSRQPNRKRR